jgi:hypothetical protein
MKNISFKAVAIAVLATLGLDIVSGIVLTMILGGDTFAPGLTEQQTKEAVARLTSSDAFLRSSLVLGTLTTVIGGYIAARLAQTVPYFNALAFGIVGVLFGVAAAGTLPLWYEIIGFGVALPAALLGGHIAKQQARRGA